MPYHMDNQTKKFVKLIVFNFALTAIIVILYSPGIIGLSLSMANPLKSALTVFITLCLSYVGIMQNKSILNGSGSSRRTKVLKASPADFGACEELLKRLEPKVFGERIDEILTLVHRMQRKTKTAREILLQYFSKTETAYIGFDEAITGVSSLFNDNVREMANHVNIFDFEEYQLLKKSKGDLSVHKQHMDYVDDQISENEAILKRMDALLIQVSDLLDSNIDLGTLPAMQDLENLIKYTKYYKRK